MRPIATDRVAWSVSRSVIVESTAKTAESIDMPFGTWSQVGPGNHVSDGSRIRWGAHWRHLANTIEPSVCGGDAPVRQIILTTCLRDSGRRWVVAGDVRQSAAVCWRQAGLLDRPVQERRPRRHVVAVPVLLRPVSTRVRSTVRSARQQIQRAGTAVYGLRRRRQRQQQRKQHQPDR